MEKIFYKCEICGNMVGLMENGGVTPVCCGKPMALLEPNTVDASEEKHVPVAVLEGNTLHVQVGDVVHPMVPEHFIQWIMVTQGPKTQRIELTPQDEPKAVFTVDADQGPILVYEYCNLHGLWVTEIK